MVMLLWAQVGFSMVLLSAAVKGVPADTLEAARIDGASERADLLPDRRPADQGTIITVFITVLIGVMKIFDIVYVMTNGNFNTNVLGNEFFNQLFTNFNNGAAAAIVVMLMIAIDPDHDLPGAALPGRGGRAMSSTQSGHRRPRPRHRGRTVRRRPHQPTRTPPARPAGSPRSSWSCICLLWLSRRSACSSRRSGRRTTRTTSGWWTVFTDPANLDRPDARELQRGLRSRPTWATAFVNSLAIALPATFIPILIAAFAAYAFTFMEFPGRDFLFLILIVGLLVVPQLGRASSRC